MKISKIKISNYRLLKDFSIDVENLLSIVIGKNNSGKTSFLSLMERFLQNYDQNRFSFDDFNIEVQFALKTHFETLPADPLDFNKHKINLRIYIDYEETDNLANISNIMLDLDPAIKTVVLSFEYGLSSEKYLQLKDDYLDFKRKINDQLTERFAENKTSEEDQAPLREKVNAKKDIVFFLKKNHTHYFKIIKKAIESGNESNFIDITSETKLIDKIINFKRIKAKRDVANEDGTSKTSDKTLSKMSSKYYDKILGDDSELSHVVDLQNELGDTDERLNVVYEGLFQNVISKVKKFGGLKEDESKLMIVSTLEDKNILINNTTVMYEHGNSHSLPEDYNGLGYMNLIAIIFEIEVLITDFKKKKFREEVPADINLLFVEEPEAHTHPQMQYVFIKNIKSLLSDASSGVDDGVSFNLQTIITTHSACITSESEFNDLKYFQRIETNKVIAKNLRHLQQQYADDNPKDYQFLKQYLTLNRSELFFADKAIFIEGDTEKLLLPAMMKKLDLEEPEVNNLPLLSQNISIVEVGAYSHIFEKFMDFLGIKTLIITDLDTYLKKPKIKDGVVVKNNDGSDKITISKCRASEGVGTTNAAIKFFYGNAELPDLMGFNHIDRIFRKDGDEWVKDQDGRLCITYQREENGYQARSFEDCFINLNLPFIKGNIDCFKSLKNKDEIDDYEDPYDIAENCVDKKTLFALDILFLSSENFDNWQTPLYIKEGLKWLKNE